MNFLSTEAALAIQSAPYLILILSSTRRLFQHRTASPFYGLLAGVTSLAALLAASTGRARPGTPVLSTATVADPRLSILGLLCATCTFFLLSKHLIRLARWQQWGLGGLLFGAALLVLAPIASSVPALLCLLGGCPLPLIFWRYSQRSSGATRWQVQWLGAALVLLLTHLLLLLAADLTPIGTVATSWAAFALFLLSGIALCLGFTPPRWLHNSWQTTEQARIGQLFATHLLSSSQPASNISPDGLAERLHDLLQQAMRTLNCQAGMIERWNETANTFEVLASASTNAPNSPREVSALKNGRFRETFTHQQNLVAPLESGKHFLPWCRPSLGALLAAPILAGGKALGVLGLACERAPLFPDYHLALLQAFAQQAALWLVSAQPSQTTTLLEQLEQEQRAKEEYLAVMVHELRSPLTVIKGRVQLLRRQLAKENQTSVLETISRLEPQFHRLEKLIDTLVDVSYLDAGRFRLNPEPLDLAALVSEAIERQRHLFPTHPLVLERTDAEESAEQTTGGPPPVWVEGDSSRLAQVLQVLLGRARQATPAGSQVTVRLERQAASGEVVVQVHDQGAGIPPEQQAQVFQRQVRSLTNPKGQAHGTGLELYISYETIRHHGGRMWLESSGLPGEGATFAFALPLLNPQPGAAAAHFSQGNLQARGFRDPGPDRSSAHHTSLPFSTNQASDRKEHPSQEITSH